MFLLFKVRSDEEAIALANSSEYGLSGSVFSKDKERAEHVLRQLESGFVFANKMVHADPRVPSGGVKSSGFGRECGFSGLTSFMNQKSMWFYD